MSPRCRQRVVGSGVAELSFVRMEARDQTKSPQRIAN